jgi:hypothetical protein
MTTSTATRPATARTRRTRTRTTAALDTTDRPATTDTGGSDGGGSEQRVRAALTDGTDLTVAALAGATGLGRSTVSKALTRLETAGDAVRTPSGSAGRARQPDRWNPTRTATTAPPSPPEPRAQQPEPEPEREEAPKVERDSQPEAIPPRGPDRRPDAEPEADAELDSDAQSEVDTEPKTTAAATAGTADEATDMDPPTAGRRPAGSSRRSPSRRPSTGDTPTAPDTLPTPDTPDTPPAAPSADGGDERRNPKTGTARLAPGALTQLVADHFGAHPGVPLTSGEVGRALGRSGGAVRNAADKLTGDGVLRLLDGTPRRYTTAE